MLMKNCEIKVTDSGGLQEEATAPSIRKPVLVIRLTTERPEAVEAGFVKVVGVEKHNILVAMELALRKKNKLPKASPYGNGTAAKEIVKIVLEETLQ